MEKTCEVNSLARWFPDRESFDHFRTEWARINDRPGLDREAALDALAFAAFHAGAEREYQAVANQVRVCRGGAEFPARARRLRKLLKDTFDELKELAQEDEILGGKGQLDKVVRIQQSRAWFDDDNSAVEDLEDAAEDAEDYKLLRVLTAMSSEKEWMIQRGPILAAGTPLATALVPAMENYFQFASRLLVLLAEMETILRRPEGSQPRPWVRRALADLTTAGLTKAEAVSLLEIIGLKGDSRKS